jgi:hypothetical protein
MGDFRVGCPHCGREYRGASTTDVDAWLNHHLSLHTARLVNPTRMRLTVPDLIMLKEAAILPPAEWLPR